jgi:hypothetical protein
MRAGGQASKAHGRFTNVVPDTQYQREELVIVSKCFAKALVLWKVVLIYKHSAPQALRRIGAKPRFGRYMHLDIAHRFLYSGELLLESAPPSRLACLQ